MKIAHIDLSDASVEDFELDATALKLFGGGRGLGVAFLDGICLMENRSSPAVHWCFP